MSFNNVTIYLKKTVKIKTVSIIISMIFLVIIPVISSGQSDTTVYYSKSSKRVLTNSEAFYFTKLTRQKGKKVDFIMTDYYLKDKKWKESGNINIKKESDSTFILTYLDREGYTEKRQHCKTDSGFLIKDYRGDILVQEGKSRLLFPLIKYGYWRHFSPSTGQIANECYYADNQFVTNKWWLNNGEYLTDVSVNCDKNAEFEGGDIALLKFVSEHLEYPIQARNNGISGRVIVSFVVMTDGSIKGIRILRGVDPLLDAEAIRVIKSLPPDKWKPAEIGGRKVKFPMMIPIGFTLN